MSKAFGTAEMADEIDTTGACCAISSGIPVSPVWTFQLALGLKIVTLGKPDVALAPSIVAFVTTSSIALRIAAAITTLLAVATMFWAWFAYSLTFLSKARKTFFTNPIRENVEPH